MLFRTSSSKVAGGFGLALVASLTWAGPTIQSWDLQKTQNQERIRVRWNEPAPVEIQEFPAARQVVIRIPEATLATREMPALDIASSPLLQKARLQPVKMADGRDGVQITLTMKEWQEVSTIATPKWLSIGYGAPEALSAEEPILLSNADFEALKYGSDNAPAEGAGQSTPSNEVFAQFWVPPDLTQAERERGAGGEDIGMIQTNELMNRYVDLDFKDAELQNIIRSIARKLNLNILMMPGQVRGSVTVSLNNVRLGDALEALLKANNLSYKIEPGGIVRIVPRSEVRGSNKETIVRSISINWIDASIIAGIIDPFLSDEGEITSAVESNQIIIKDVPEVVQEVQDLVLRLDVPEKQVRMETRLVDMTENATRAMGFQWGLIEQDSTFGQPDLELEAGSVPAVSALTMAATENISVFGSTFRLDAELRAQEDRGEAVTLANPLILSLNNQAASIEIKRQIPYRDAVNTTQGSVATIKFKDVGTRVELTPRITNNGFVTMQIATDQKILVDLDDLTNVPIIDERRSATSVTVKDEQTITLGGLRQFESVGSESGVPWLLRVPVLQWLFKSQNRRVQKLDLYLFVTPHIIKDPEPTVFEMGVYDKIDYNWDIPDYYFDEVRPRKSDAELNDPRVKGQY